MNYRDVIWKASHLIKVEHQVQFTHIPKKLIQDLDEEVDCFQVCQLVIVGVNARAEEQPRISSVHDLRAAFELDEIRLIFLVSRRDKAMDLGFISQRG